MITNIFELAGTDSYRAEIFPDLYEDEKPMRVSNWHTEDLAPYVGGVFAEMDAASRGIFAPQKTGGAA